MNILDAMKKLGFAERDPLFSRVQQILDECLTDGTSTAKIPLIMASRFSKDELIRLKSLTLETIDLCEQADL